MYPAFTLLVAVVAAIVLVTYSLPSLSGLLSEVGSDQPTSTRVLIGVSNFFGEYGVSILIGLAVLAVLIFVALRTEIGRAATDTVLLRVPVIGRVIVANNMFSLTSILSTLLKSGMSPVEALRLTQRGMANAYYRRRLGRVIDRATEGTKLGEAFEEEGGFPPIVSQAIVTGETRGSLDDTMSGLSEYYEDVTKRAAGGITELIQPAIILFVAGMVGFVAVAIISGIYSALGPSDERRLAGKYANLRRRRPAGIGLEEHAQNQLRSRAASIPLLSRNRDSRGGPDCRGFGRPDLLWSPSGRAG